ncbi:MAG TPA: thiamine-phosphate kinase [Gammaproteobacteria bacterium]
MPRSREFEIIERFFTRPVTDPAIEVGIGDDAAVVDVAGRLAIAVDTIVAGTHFPDPTPARAIGHRVLAVNLSDLAALGSRPRWATLALSLPASDLAWVEEFAAGFFALAEQHGVSLIGGDTVRGALAATVQVMGDVGDAPLLRSGGRVGDLVFVSGSLGDSAAGLACAGGEAELNTPAATALIERFRYPEPRVDLGLALGGIARAAIDISDGLVVDLGRICSQSRCGAEIELDSLPLSAALRAEFPDDRATELALHGGDDYELCFTAAPADAAAIEDLGARVGTPVTQIGRLTEGSGVVGSSGGNRFDLVPAGFGHFGT